MTIDTRRRDFLAAGGLAAALAASPAAPRAQAAGSLAQVGFSETFDVVVVGAGSAGCVAALIAQDAGAQVLVLEKGAAPGGTSIKSGGSVWIPNHPYLAAKNKVDGRDDFLKFAARCVFPESYDPADATLGIPAYSLRLLETFYDNGSAMVAKLSAMGAWKSEIWDPGFLFPDYRAEVPENKMPTSRVLQSVPRFPDGPDAGDEFIGQLVSALRGRKVPIRSRHRVTSLIRNGGGEVVGVEVADASGTTKRIGARRGVVFATGGFTHNRDLLSRYQHAPVFGGCAAPTATGDFVPIAAEMGAQFGNMACAWRAPVVLDQSAQYVSAPVDAFFIMADSMVMVNRAGRRCGNERRAYHDRVLGMYRWDEQTGDYPDLIQVAIYDQRSAELFAGIMPIPPTPMGIDYMIEGKDLDDLAAKVDERLASLADVARNARLEPAFAQQLKVTVQRFNQFAETGVDEDFGRGSGMLDRFDMQVSSARWPKSDKPNPVMYPISAEGPYYAMILAPGLLDTNGGPVIDTKARVLDSDDKPIPGLFGAGNCIASPARDAYFAGGITLGMAMTFGMIAGASSAAETPRALS
jgi:3-oxosteroid 1-dehydrogenase